MDEELAYLAGFFDGEGSISIIKTKNGHSLVLSVSQLNPVPLIRLQARFGGSVHRQPDRRGNRSMVVWTTAARRGLAALETLRPYLLVKADEAHVGIDFQANRDGWTDKTAELERRDRLHARLKELKQRSYDEVELPPTVKAPRMSSPRHLVRPEKMWAKPKAPKPPKKVRVKKAPVRSTGYDRSKKPSKEMLAEVYADIGLSLTAMNYGVSRQTIVTWLKAYDIPRQGRTAASEERRHRAVAASWRSTMTEEPKDPAASVEASNDREFEAEKAGPDLGAEAAVKASNDREFKEESREQSA